MRPCNHSDSHASKWCRDEPPPPTGLGFLLPFGPAAASLSAAPYRCKALTTPVNTQRYNGLHFRPMALSTLAIPPYLGLLWTSNAPIAAKNIPILVMTSGTPSGPNEGSGLGGTGHSAFGS